MCGTRQLLTASSLLLLRCAEASASMKVSREKPPADDPAELTRRVRPGLDLRALAAAVSCVPSQQASLLGVVCMAMTDDVVDFTTQLLSSPKRQRILLQDTVRHVGFLGRQCMLCIK